LQLNAEMPVRLCAPSASSPVNKKGSDREDLKQGKLQLPEKVQLAKFVSWNDCWKVALGTQFCAMHHCQLWPPDPVQLISYLPVHCLCGVWEGYGSSPLFSIFLLSYFSPYYLLISPYFFWRVLHLQRC